MQALKEYRSFPFTAPEQAWVLGGKTKLTFEGFVETAAENEKRTIIAGFELYCRISLSNATVGEVSTSLDGRDLYRVFRSITVIQKDGVKRYDEISGDALRVFNYAVMGAYKTREHGDFAVTDGGEPENPDVPVTVIVACYVPMIKAYADEPYEFAMPADVFSLIRIGMAQDADLSLGGAAITVRSAQYWVSADCYAEPTAKTYAVDTVVMDDFDATTQSKFNISGRPHDVLAYVPGAAGGARLTGIDEVMVVDVYQQSQLTNPDLITRYARERDVVEGSAATRGAPLKLDPFVPETNLVAPRALAFLLTTGNHPDEGEVRANLTIKLTESSSPGTVRVILRVLEERTDKLDAAQAKKYGATGTVPDRNPAEKKIAPRDAKFFAAKLTR